MYIKIVVESTEDLILKIENDGAETIQGFLGEEWILIARSLASNQRRGNGVN